MKFVQEMVNSQLENLEFINILPSIPKVLTLRIPIKLFTTRVLLCDETSSKIVVQMAFQSITCYHIVNTCIYCLHVS